MAKTAGGKSLFAPGIAAVKHHIKPFLLIQFCAFLLVIAYYNSSAIQTATAGLGEFKVKGGLPFAALATAFAGLCVPEFFKHIVAPRSKWPRLADLLFQIGIFSLIGSFVDILYRFLGSVFGNGADFQTVATKVLLDQLGFSPLVSIPVSTLGFMWRDFNFDTGRTIAALKNGEFRKRFAPLMVTCWSFWFPCLIAVYAMPGNLQFCLFLLVQGAWSLLLVHMSSVEQSQHHEDQ